MFLYFFQMFWLWSCDPFIGIQTYQAEVSGIWQHQIAFLASSTAFRTAAPPEALMGKREAPEKEGEEIIFSHVFF